MSRAIVYGGSYPVAVTVLGLALFITPPAARPR